MQKTSKALLTTWLLSTFLCSVALAAPPSQNTATSEGKGVTSYRVSSVSWEQSDDNYILRIKGDTTPTFTMYELFEPLRVMIDIADASLDNTVALPLEIPHGPVSQVNGNVLEDKEPYITRIELLLTEDQSYTVERVDNDIIVKFPKSTGEQPTSTVDDPQADQTTDMEMAAVEEPVVTEELILPDSTSSIEKETPVDLAESIQEHATVVSDIEISHQGDETEVYLKADGPIKNYKKVHLEKNLEANRPDRMYLDLVNLELAGSFETKTVGTALAKIRTAKREDGFRVVFDSGLDQLFDYAITEQPDGLLVTIKEPSAATAVIANLLSEDGVEPELTVAPEPQSVDDETEVVPDAGESQTPPTTTLMPEIEPAKPVIASTPETQKKNSKSSKSSKPSTSRTPSANDLAFAGYNKQRITVDFYKIDLHNVFRLFGEISNLNIVVDEGVGGSLTLALNDVPWDFALDIILNLKDLQKEERFNTIVISPKSKMFTWPERTLDKVEFKADLKIQQEEAQETGGIKVSKRLEVPETVIEAKKLIHQAQVNERNGNYEAALPLYEEAVAKWGDNINLAKKIAAICLVNLEQNSKAVYYAKSALKLNPTDQEAALQAAIGLARMKRDAEAKEYFELSTSGAKPPGEALTSYATYCEEKQNYDCSIEMLKLNEDLYGDNLSTMVSKARVLDKQGNQELAANEYRAILLSGYEIPSDLARYIKGRASLGGN
jgi:type IV pilus assembly protein PilQ